MKSSYIIPFAILLGGAMVATAIYISIPKTYHTSGNPALVRPVDTTDHILGNPAAPVQIIEYADFDCEYCKNTDDILHQIIANQGTDGSVAWVYREFPLTEIHPNALRHAEAAECAALVAGNDAFWRFKSALFAHQPADPATYGTLAKTIGLSGSDFATCVANAATTVDVRIMADRKNALDMGAPGTPYSLILVAGKAPVVMSGAYSYDDVKQLVDQARAK